MCCCLGERRRNEKPTRNELLLYIQERGRFRLLYENMTDDDVVFGVCFLLILTW